MHAHRIALALAAALVLLAPAARADSALTLDVGVIAASIAGGGTVGGSWQLDLYRSGRCSFEARAHALATGLRSGEPGAVAGALAVGSCDLAPSLPLLVDLAAGPQAITLRACGTENCGRLTGVVPAVSLRVVYVCASCWEGALGLALNGGWTYADSPTVAAGSLWSFALGPYWRFGRKD